MKKAITIAFIGLCLTAPHILAQAGSWGNTAALAVIGNNLYTVEKDGTLYRTDLASGKWVKIGKSEFAHTKFMFASGGTLFTIESDGSLYRVSPSDGAWSRIGKAGDWSRTMSGAMIGDKLFTVESGGELYETNTTSGVWRQMGKAEFVRTKFLLGGGGALYTIEGDGNLYAVNPANGSWKQVGSSNEWVNTLRSTMHGGKMYTIESNGALYETNPQTGAWRQIGKKNSAAQNSFFRRAVHSTRSNTMATFTGSIRPTAAGSGSVGKFSSPQ
jgi:hypothetical protein